MLFRPTLSMCALLWPALMLAQEASIPVTVARAKLGTVVNTLELSGSIVAKRQARLSSRASGLIKKLHVDAGSSVKAGDVLMELDSTQAALVMDRIKVESEQANAELTEANRQLEEVRSLAKTGGFSKSEAETRETAARVQSAIVKRIAVQLSEQQEIIARHQLLAPFDGVIRLKQAEEGEWVQTGTPVVELVETGNVLLDVQAPQEFYAQLTDDVVVTARLDAHYRTEFKAKVATRVAASDRISRTFLARLALDDPQRLAIPGMSARVTFHFKDKDTALQVPRDAIVRSQDGGVTVWSVTPTPDKDGTGTVKAHAVKTGPAFSDLIVILEGLAPGATVVLNGNESLREGQRRESLLSQSSMAALESAGEPCHAFSMDARLQIDPQICHGKPVIKGTRVLVSTLLGALGGGDSIEELLADYPSVTRQDILAALEFAGQLSGYQILEYEAVP